jgi:hypothetical protein
MPFARNRILDALREQKAALAADPILTQLEPRLDLRALEKSLESFVEESEEDAEPNELFEALAGQSHGQRFAAFSLMRSLFEPDAPLVLGRLDEQTAEHFCYISGDLKITGDVVNHGDLLITGDLTIEGNYVGEVYDYSCVYVGGTMRVRNLSTYGEVLVSGKLEADFLHLYGNDYSALARGVKARVVVIDDHDTVFGKLEAETQVDRLDRAASFMEKSVLDRLGKGIDSGSVMAEILAAQRNILVER